MTKINNTNLAKIMVEIKSGQNKNLKIKCGQNVVKTWFAEGNMVGKQSISNKKWPTTDEIAKKRGSKSAKTWLKKK